MTKDINLDEINDLGNLLRKSDLDVVIKKGLPSVIFDRESDEFNSLDKVEKKLDTVIKLINNSTNYGFIVDYGQINQSQKEYEVPLYFRKNSFKTYRR